jgi:predicted nicotinamide N-methyase
LNPPDPALRLIHAYTQLRSPTIVPEITLHLASEILGLWQESEALLYAKSVAAGDTPPPYWAFAWPGGQALGRYILDIPEICRGRCVLDFGSGSGLVAIAAALAGAQPVIAAETDASARTAIELNAAANGVFVEALEYDVIGWSCRWDVILAGDMCYERPLAERLLVWLRHLASEGARVLIGDPGRNYFPRNGVEKLATYQVPTSRDLEDRDMRETSVYTVLPA